MFGNNLGNKGGLNQENFGKGMKNDLND